MHKWFEASQLVSNAGGKNIVIFKTNNLPHNPLIIYYEEKCMKKITNMKFLGIRI
jgi:hypothetical protein